MLYQEPGGQISSVTGAALSAGIQSGDRLLAVDGICLRDVIDFRFYADGPEAEFQLARGESRLTLPVCRSEGSDWGIEFAEPLFDRVRRCANRCIFCFLDQLPRGWRQSLYLRDDDYRLSFLFGNFVTLTNLQEDDWARLKEQRLSPLYVSVHSTDLALRQLLLGRERIPDILQQLDRLGRLNASVHAQVVLCPGINDGVYLEQTVAELAQRSSVIRSLALVPVGLTRFRSPTWGLTGVDARLRPYTSTEARSVLRWARPIQGELRNRLGRNFLYLADEFYMLADRPVPATRFYDGFPQLENGVGLVRLLRDDWFRTRRHLPRSSRLGITLVCATLVAPQLRQMAAELTGRVEGLSVDIVAVENHTFGPTVTVSGLLTGETLVQSLRKKKLGEILFLPRAAFDERGEYTLDNVSLGTLQEEFGRPIVLVERMSEVVREIKERRGG